MSTEHIHDGAEARQKLKELVEGIKFCFFCSNLSFRPFDATPMTTQAVDPDGTIWFVGSKETSTYQTILSDPSVQLLYASPSDAKYVSIYGMAEAIYDRQRIEQYWNAFVEGWFQEGKDDPKVILIRVRPTDAHYWDTKSNKMVAYAKAVFSALTGTKHDEGRHGDIAL